MAEAYNPLHHSVVQALTGPWLRYECDDFVEALLDAILEEIGRVHWNVYQHAWGPTWHADEIEDPEIDGISFVRFYQDRCDCGGLRPQHAADCDHTLHFHKWNRRRVDALTNPDGTVEFFNEQREATFLATDPRPPCTCGAEAVWDEDRGCLPTCIGQRPNFQFEDVAFSWYKRPGRGMSTNMDWSPEQWRDWFLRCMAHVRAFEGDPLREANRKRYKRLRASMMERFPNAFPEWRRTPKGE